MNRKEIIILNKTLAEYKKKYKNRYYHLLKYTKAQVEEFDKQYKPFVYNDKKQTLNLKNELLKNRTWWLIGDTYYEAPRPISFGWFRNLHIACQVGTAVIGVGVLATAITLPIVLNKSAGGEKEITSFTLERNVESTSAATYFVSNLKLKKNSSYTFILNLNADDVLFGGSIDDDSSPVLTKLIAKNDSGADLHWTIDSEYPSSFGTNSEEGPMKISITAEIDKDITSGTFYVMAGGK